MIQSLRIVLHDVHFLQPHHVTAVIILKLNAMLQRHTKVARLVVVVEELLRRMHLNTRASIRRPRKASKTPETQHRQTPLPNSADTSNSALICRLYPADARDAA